LFIDQWNRERPDLDPAALGVVSRVLMLAKLLEQSADRALASSDLSLWQFDVLAALRRSGAPYKLSPTQLMQLVTLTSGAMTNRIDRLEELGLVTRENDPDDRRGTLIALTRAGRKVVDEAIGARLADARSNLTALSDAERKTLGSLLRRLLITNGGAAHNGRSRSDKGKVNRTLTG
jgi:DNA-binding MarR family transcriptional regulator